MTVLRYIQALRFFCPRLIRACSIGYARRCISRKPSAASRLISITFSLCAAGCPLCHTYRLIFHGFFTPHRTIDFLVDPLLLGVAPVNINLEAHAVVMSAPADHMWWAGGRAGSTTHDTVLAQHSVPVWIARHVPAVVARLQQRRVRCAVGRRPVWCFPTTWRRRKHLVDRPWQRRRAKQRGPAVRECCSSSEVEDASRVSRHVPTERQHLVAAHVAGSAGRVPLPGHALEAEGAAATVLTAFSRICRAPHRGATGVGARARAAHRMVPETVVPSVRDAGQRRTRSQARRGQQ